MVHRQLMFKAVWIEYAMYRLPSNLLMEQILFKCNAYARYDQSICLRSDRCGIHCLQIDYSFHMSQEAYAFQSTSRHQIWRFFDDCCCTSHCDIELSKLQEVSRILIDCSGMLLQEYKEEMDEVEVEHKDFENALSNLTPSLSMEELARYQALRQKYQSL